MTAFMHDAARASLPVAVALLIFAAAARAVLWAQIDDPAAQRVARQYVEPLGTWCLVAVATHILALGAAGEAHPTSLAIPFLAGAAAVLLRSVGEADQPPVVEPEEPPAAEPSPPGAAPLWSRTTPRNP